MDPDPIGLVSSQEEQIRTEGTITGRGWDGVCTSVNTRESRQPPGTQREVEHVLLEPPKGCSPTSP